MERIIVMIVLIILTTSGFILNGDSNAIVDDDEIPTRALEVWTMDMNIADASTASYLGNEQSYGIGGVVTVAGDVNGDGYEDILIGRCIGPTKTIGAYLIFGNGLEWSMDTYLSSAAICFASEKDLTMDCAGDVNGDGYDDIVIGSRYEGGGAIYLFFGRPSGWNANIDLSDANVSFISENAGDQAGRSLSGAGDVNGDGLDDIIIGAPQNSDGGDRAGKTYLIFGKETGWETNMSLADADASFIGERVYYSSGSSVSGAGDVNGDDFDDFLIGPSWPLEGFGSYLILGKKTGWEINCSLSEADGYFNREFGPSDWFGISASGAGDVNGDGLDDISLWCERKMHLVFGMTSGWKRDMNLTFSNASFISERGGDIIRSFAGGGDVNADGFDDILIGIPYNEETEDYRGENYLIWGKGSGWEQDVNLSRSDASFIGDTANDWSGYSISISGDVNGDRYDDILIGAIGNYEGGENAGQTYLIMGMGDLEPQEVYSVKIFSDEAYSNEIDSATLDDQIFIELIGDDKNVTIKGRACVMVSSIRNENFTLPVFLEETGIHTGIYRSKMKISTRNDPVTNTFKVSPGDIIKVSAHKDSSKYSIFGVISPVLLRPFEDVNSVFEDIEYRVQYENIGFNEVTKWTFETNADWLDWNDEIHEMSGTPDNGDVGLKWARINITDGFGHYNEHHFSIVVKNNPPKLIFENIVQIDQDEQYYADYDCDDDGQGNVSYMLYTNADWLNLDPITGILTGVPTNADVGEAIVNVTVSDGNGGYDHIEFDLTINNLNDPPLILTEDITTITQDDPYIRNYIAEDIDAGDELIWKLNTDAKFLSIDENTGTLSGTTSYLDVGSFFVNVSVWDNSDANDFHNFTLTVLNLNDPTIWVDFPPNSQIVHGRIFLFDTNAIDYDDDELTYSISSMPDSDITIDPVTGLINWTADIHLFDSEPYKLNVIVSVFDGLINSTRTFTIAVLPSEPPFVDLIGPNDRVRTSSSATVLKWEGTDPEDEPITYNIYLHQTEAFVQGLREEALFDKDYPGGNITLTSLVPGKTYFWTVIPNDGCSFGECTSGVHSFRVNYKPTFNNIEDHEVPAGTDFKFKISCTDLDTEDLPHLRYSLVEAPDGMTISEETGMIRWTPKDDQVKLHIVTVGISDGIETNTATFEVEVIEGESSASSILIIILIVVLIAILLAMGIFFFMRKKKQLDEEALKRGEEEIATLEKEREDEYASYEDLYGVPAPVKDEEELTTRELKDYIHEKIEEMESEG